MPSINPWIIFFWCNSVRSNRLRSNRSEKVPTGTFGVPVLFSIEVPTSEKVGTIAFHAGGDILSSIEYFLTLLIPHPPSILPTSACVYLIYTVQNCCQYCYSLVYIRFDFYEINHKKKPILNLMSISFKSLVPN